MHYYTAKKNLLALVIFNSLKFISIEFNSIYCMCVDYKINHAKNNVDPILFFS